MKKAGAKPTLPEIACALAARCPKSQLHPAVLAWADPRPRREKWGVAFSGGADSLALLLLLWAHWPERRSSLIALHFNHRLRGRASRADATFCRKVAAALGVKLVLGEWKNPPREASEADARAARLAFFRPHARVVWLGHQQDDIAESMLMRLARGSGAGGLSAPRPVQRWPRNRVHLRPLLTCKKAEIVAKLREAGASWREDATNSGPTFFRNRIRVQVIPAWQESAQRDALAGAARARELLEEDDVALDAWLDELIGDTRPRELHLDRLAGRPRAIMRRALHRWLVAQPHAGELSRQAFDALLAAVSAGKPTRQSIGVAGFAVIRAGVLSFAPQRNSARKFHRRAN